jgi:HSP20 family protein
MSGELTRWKPFEGLTMLRRDMDRLWDRFIGDDWLPIRERNGWAPSLDISETKNNLIVKTEIAGVDPKEVNISVSGDVLSIKGEKKEEKEEKDENYHLMESSYGSFSRTVRLPVEVEQDKIKASCKNGVLKITLPKSTKSKAKEIKIDVEK